MLPRAHALYGLVKARDLCPFTNPELAGPAFI
jgi:hypothetical protein